MSTAAVSAPTNLDGLGLPKVLVEDLALKIVYLNGELSVQELATKMCVSITIADEVCRRLRKEQLCEVTGMTGDWLRLQTTSSGKARALEVLQLSQYAGPTPVSLEHYIAQVRCQSIRQLDVHLRDVERALQHLVVDRHIITQLGTALTSGRAIFLYGSTGTGKTTLAEALTTLFRRQAVWIPYAVEVDAQIITVYDPHSHEQTEEQLTPSSDRRWVLCRRPKVVVGGELTMEMLDLQLNPMSKFYTAPIQMKANNGILIIDDFGRQRVRPDELLNRWVIPLDRQVDFLSLVGGKKIGIPFDMFVAFATNLDPARLVDEAFMRRIQNKIKVDFLRPDQFHAIFANVCRDTKLEYNPKIVDGLIDIITREMKQPLRACYPLDIVSQICCAARFEGKEPKLDRTTVEQACYNYFIPPEPI